MEDKLATKQDLRELELRLRSERLLKIGAMQVASIAVIVALIKII